jgi:hypothetical protein
MTVPYTKHSVGNRLFVVEWDFDTTVAQQFGDAFEAVDAKLLSVNAWKSNPSIIARLYSGNHSQAMIYPQTAMWIPLVDLLSIGGILYPYPVQMNTSPPAELPLLPPPCRWYWPTAEEVDSATLKVALLFEVI